MKENNIVVSIFATAFKIVMAIIIVMLVFTWSRDAYDFGRRVFAEEPVNVGTGRTISVTIADGYSSKEIGELLEYNGLIRDANVFFFQEFLSQYKGQLKPGTYELSTSMTIEEMMKIMSEG
ncbi:MAG: endolytic transglycosylase MltG [Lachnospiraceae bacterium]